MEMLADTCKSSSAADIVPLGHIVLILTYQIWYGDDNESVNFIPLTTRVLRI